MDRNFEVVTALAALGIHLHKPEEVTYKYVDVHTALKIIRNRNLLYQCPGKFNDPLDPHTGLLNLLPFGKTHIEKYKGIASPLQLQTIENKLESTSDIVIRKKINAAGILCLSKTFKQTLMWSHYANKHTGICLGFKNLGVTGDGVSAVVVKYADTVEPRDFTAPAVSTNNSIAMLNMYCTKAKAWEYEEEVRIIDFKKNGLMPFNISDLQEIYFGVNSKQSETKTVLDAIKGRGYELNKKGKMKTNKKRFELEPEYF